jgi:hypothetical protein
VEEILDDHVQVAGVALILDANPTHDAQSRSDADNQMPIDTAGVHGSGRGSQVNKLWL